MPEEPTPPVDPAQADAGAEWTDESGYEELEAELMEATAVDDPLDDEWEAAVKDWEEDIPAPSEELEDATTTQEALAWVKPTWQRFRASWFRLIAGVRRRIPAAANLSNGVISAILVGILGLLLVLLNSVRQPSVAVERSPSADTPSSAPVTAPPAVEPAPVAPESAPAIAPPPKSDAPAPEAVVDIERIGKIQAQLTDSSIYNASRVIDSVQADFTNNRLTLTCNDDWFRLSDYDQNLLASQLKNQSNELFFQDLQLQTSEGQMIARNPVIGDEMMILLREKPPVVQPPERPRYRITIDR